MLTLKDLRPGEAARVRGLVGEGVVFQRLCELGFVSGVELRVVRYAPLGDPMEVALESSRLSLRKAEAALVEVERLEEASPQPAAADAPAGLADSTLWS